MSNDTEKPADAGPRSSEQLGAVLEPCPFCSGTDLVTQTSDGDGGWPFVRCMECGARGPCVRISYDKALADWNARARPIGVIVRPDGFEVAMSTGPNVVLVPGA